MVESDRPKKITVHTDGACDGNAGPGGWTALLRYGTHARELTGGEPATTNNRMEPLGLWNPTILCKTSHRENDPDSESRPVRLRGSFR
jgi:ribonuclease HI